jgi:SAM-dependent methyltransferase
MTARIDRTAARTVDPAAMAVVTSYTARTRFARAETATVLRPRLLRGLLATATHVAELPCGAGHFLTDYGDARLAVTLADANAAMLAQARAHARDAGLPPDRTHTIQVACTHSGGAVDTAGFYDPARQHGVWLADRWLDPAQAGGAVLRRRRQIRDGDRLRIQFDYRNAADARLHATTVELALFSADVLAAAFTAAGFGHVRFLAG